MVLKPFVIAKGP